MNTTTYKQVIETIKRSSKDNEYNIYLSCANDGKGNDFTTGKPLKTYDEWLIVKRSKLI